MTLVQLSLHNYMIHRDLTENFEGNMIALTGEMGHGKSTFVGAIQFCLTGEHPPWHRDDLLSWGTSEGSAKLDFIQDGISCSILRRLHNSDAILKIGDDTVTGARNVEKAMTERLGVDKDILKQIGFVQQYEIQSILFDDPGKRERSFQKLLGIGEASKIWTELGPIIQSYSRSENFDASIESLKQMIKRLEEGLESVDRNLKLSTDALAKVPSRDEMNMEISRLTKIQTNIVMFDNVKDTLVKLNQQMQEYAVADTVATKKMNDILDNLKCSVEDMEKFIESLRTDYNVKLTSLNNMRKLSGSSDSSGICPLCGSSVGPGQISQHTASRLEVLEKEERDAKKNYENTFNTFSLIKKELAQIDATITSARNGMLTVSARIDMEKSREKWLLNEFASLNISPEQMSVDTLRAEVSSKLNKYRAIFANYDELNSQISQLQGEKNAKKQQLDQTVVMLNEKIKEKELSVPMAKKIEVLTNVRNWFHSSNGPRTMSLSAIKAMTGYVNEYLRELHSEIEVIPDNQGLSFAFYYIDGRPVSDPPPSTAKLSGGQKIELALAFRLAIYRYFGQKMGIMVLDEPTAHLSPAGIEYFGTLLQTVNTLAKNMNLQIIMPTHEKEIMPYMDSEIHFS